VKKIKTEKEIREHLKDWKELKGCLLDCGDTVSLIVAEQAEKFISTLEWVLE